MASPEGENAYDETTRSILSELSGLDVRVSGGNVVVPDRNVEICPGFRLGSLRDSSLRDLVDGYDPRTDPDARLILEQGTEGLLERARELGIEDVPKRSCTICGLCTALREVPRWRRDERASR